jgi:hypothetical protein
MSRERRDNIEIGLNKDGTLDEILVYDKHGKCLFHLEQMDDSYYWMRAYGITQDLIAHIGATTGLVRNKPITNEKGYVIGHEECEGPKVWRKHEWDDSVMESSCLPDLHTPEAERHAEIAEIINKYGVASTLQDIANVLRKGRMAKHEQAVVADLENTRVKFLAGDKAYWDARIAEDLGENI